MNYKNLTYKESKEIIDNTDYKTNIITSKIIKDFRQLTGRGIMISKRALIECNGNFSKALELLNDTGDYGTFYGR
jgi:hypothetical protein